MAYHDREPSGIGGWLLIFILTLCVFTPATAVFASLGQLYSGPLEAELASRAGWSTYRAGETILVLMHIAVLLYLTWRLIKVRQWSSVRLTIWGIWIVSTGIVFIDFLLTALLLGVDLGRLVSAELMSGLRVSVYCTLWTLYLLKSKRVANTYPRDESGVDALSEVFQ